MLVSILCFIIIFTVIVVSHEFGHFIVAKACGIRVLEFTIGVGPKLIHFKKGGTEFSIRLLPFGGACIYDGLAGIADEEEKEDKEGGDGKKQNFFRKLLILETPEEDNEKSADSVAEMGSSEVSASTTETFAESGLAESTMLCNVEESEADGQETEAEPGKGSFLKASPWARFGTLIAGPFANLILGFLIAFIMVQFMVIRDPVATYIMPGSPAEEAGMQDGDRIISMNGSRIYLYDDILLFTTLFDGGDVELVYERNGERISTLLTPYYSEETGRFMIGFSNASFVELKGFDSFKYAWYEVRYNLRSVYSAISHLFGEHREKAELTGPVGMVEIVETTYENTKEFGWETVLLNMMNIALMLTVNLGIMNLMPLPALDGGRLIFVIIELITGKPVPPKREAIVHFIGMVALVILMVVVFFKDIRNFIL